MEVRVTTEVMLVCFMLLFVTSVNSLNRDEGQARDWLRQYDRDASLNKYLYGEVAWKYNTNITDQNLKNQVTEDLKQSEWYKGKAEDAAKFDWKNFQNETMVRLFRFATNIGTAAMIDKAKLEQMSSIQSRMEGMYSTAKVEIDGKRVSLNPVLYNIMSTSRDYNRLLKVWKGWRRATGPQMKPLFQQFVNLSNEASRDAGYADTGEYWRSSYESSTFQKDLKDLLDQLNPLYTQLHAYVRKRLKAQYGADKFPQSGHIPAHLLGNMWAQQWDIYDLVQPYSGRPAVDVTAAMKQQRYTVKRMFKIAERFFTSLGFVKLPQSFWDDSMLVKPPDREVVCHASAWDFYNAKDFRIKMCATVNHGDLIVIHHEMGHIYYFIQYKNQPVLFRDGANAGFHEAIGDVISLSVNTPGHLYTIRLLEQADSNHMDDINFLMTMALRKLAFLPFGYLIDQWRWSVFAGDTTPDHYNDKWWQLRCKHQGISNPQTPSADDFDPGSKFHVPGNTPYIRYFVSHVLQFQFQEALCKAAGHTGPLYKCDIYRSDPAGQLLRRMLSYGSSRPWEDVLEEMTGQRKMDAQPVLDYFQPLLDWLKEQNSGEQVGWTPDCPQ